MVSECIFFYGTLLPEIVPRKLANMVGRLKEVGPGTVRGQLYDLGSYPGAILNGKGRIRGRVFALPEDFEIPEAREILRILDEYEGFHPDIRNCEFVRRKCRVVLHDGRKIGCWIYEYGRKADTARLIANGNYLERLRKLRKEPQGRTRPR